MTEPEWNSCCEPAKMVAFVGYTGKASDRKLRLFAVAACRSSWRGIGPDLELKYAVAEAYGDGVVPLEEVRKHWGHSETSDLSWPEQPTEWAVGLARTRSEVQRLLRAALARCIFGNPFRPLPPLPASLLTWNDGLVVRMANSIYDERILPSGELDPDRLAVLADALEEAGCTDTTILSHLRGPGPHVRGCWPVDLILSKE